MANGEIKLSNFATTDRFDFNTGSTYTGSATYATATAIPSGGVITNTLPNPAMPQIYTVRVFSSNGCTQDIQTTLHPAICPVTCVSPSGMTITPTQATCTGTTANNNAQVAITGVTNGDRVGISTGATYSGPNYATAQALTAGAYTFINLSNPSAAQSYTIRIFNGTNDCYDQRTP